MGMECQISMIEILTNPPPLGVFTPPLPVSAIRSSIPALLMLCYYLNLFNVLIQHFIIIVFFFRLRRLFLNFYVSSILFNNFFSFSLFFFLCFDIPFFLCFDFPFLLLSSSLDKSSLSNVV